jgi:hypothetical protein
VKLEHQVARLSISDGVTAKDLLNELEQCRLPATEQPTKELAARLSAMAKTIRQH